MEVKTDEKTSDSQYTSTSKFTEQLCQEHLPSEKIIRLNIKTNITGRLYQKKWSQNNLTLVWQIEAKQNK